MNRGAAAMDSMRKSNVFLNIKVCKQFLLDSMNLKMSVIWNLQDNFDQSGAQNEMSEDHQCH